MIDRCPPTLPTIAAGASTTDVERPGIVLQMGWPPVRIDVVRYMTGVSFSEAWSGRLRPDFGGVEVAVRGREAFIRNKRATGRLIDLDVIETPNGGL